MTEKKIIKIIESITKTDKNLLKSTDLVAQEILDSFSIIILISKLEKEFKIKINMEKFEIKNLKTIKSILLFIKKNR